MSLWAAGGAADEPLGRSPAFALEPALVTWEGGAAVRETLDAALTEVETGTFGCLVS